MFKQKEERRRKKWILVAKKQKKAARQRTEKLLWKLSQPHDKKEHKLWIKSKYFNRVYYFHCGIFLSVFVFFVFIYLFIFSTRFIETVLCVCWFTVGFQYLVGLFVGYDKFSHLPFLWLHLSISNGSVLFWPIENCVCVCVLGVSSILWPRCVRYRFWGA